MRRIYLVDAPHLPSDRNYKYPVDQTNYKFRKKPKTEDQTGGTKDEFSQGGSTRHTQIKDTRAVRRCCMCLIH
jgi:hypothetical protein